MPLYFHFFNFRAFAECRATAAFLLVASPDTKKKPATELRCGLLFLLFALSWYSSTFSPNSACSFKSSAVGRECGLCIVLTILRILGKNLGLIRGGNLRFCVKDIRQRLIPAGMRRVFLHQCEDGPSETTSILEPFSSLGVCAFNRAANAIPSGASSSTAPSASPPRPRFRADASQAHRKSQEEGACQGKEEGAGASRGG